MSRACPSVDSSVKQNQIRVEGDDSIRGSDKVTSVEAKGVDLGLACPVLEWV